MRQSKYNSYFYNELKNLKKIFKNKLDEQIK